MTYKTLSEIRSEVKKALDLEEESFIPDAEILLYINEAIDIAESEIHKIHEDYFLAESTVSLVNGTSEYALPTNIYANKIRSVIYSNGSEVYEVNRISKLNSFIEVQQVRSFGSSERYQYMLKNDSANDGVEMILLPASRETSTNLKIWYLRNSNRLSIDADKCDIPEFYHFVTQYTKVRCYEKEGHPQHTSAVGVLSQLRDQMVQTLTGMVPDDKDQIPLDLTHYQEHS